MNIIRKLNSAERHNRTALAYTRAGTAILDVLIPPYDEACGRDCTYYRPEHSTAGGGQVRLVPCSPGDEFRVVRGEFVSPLPS